MIQHEKYMKKCIELAKKAEGKVSPNPLVGAVALDKYGNLAGEGFHEKYGESHAEVNALAVAGERAREGTLYVNLEPCCHYGKTPPCIDRVLESGVKKLVIGMTDPSPKVAGKSITIARESGIDVVENVLNKECLKLNEIFIKNISEKKPFIAIKTASTMDGKIAAYSGKSKWITSENARKEVHRLRNKYDAIITGSGTVIADNPSLTCRMDGGRNPIRIIVDSKLITPKNAAVYQDDGTKIFLATAENVDTKDKYPDNVEILKCPMKNDKLDLNYLIKKLYEKNIYSIIVESGSKLNGAFLKEKLANKIYFFLAPKLMCDKNALSLCEGLNSESPEQCIKLRFDEIKSFSPDIMIEGYLNEKNT
ncbi:MAG TPA: bifunctional diaminohydroxyphosphoribosylaminopyrimidine deaminase/5-amino-6-(5-phosphoribosylamino)uracil reductase RibD [Candidatus Gastranaerophilales bacterium]|nr:bifunctional diaminohydroxyphosphoribosylaminopyrimidine deaminase/5-amino-6-(5-phosphoribosylamino)uracil reductase RibD [Candidatus Gastranaerophilales bacterium]